MYKRSKLNQYKTNMRSSEASSWKSQRRLVESSQHSSSDLPQEYRKRTTSDFTIQDLIPSSRRKSAISDLSMLIEGLKEERTVLLRDAEGAGSPSSIEVLRRIGSLDTRIAAIEALMEDR